MRSLSSALSFNDFRRKIINYLMIGLIVLAAVIALAPLFNVFYYVFERGIKYLSWDFFVSLPAPVGETGGGMGNAVIGSLKIVGMACVLGVPWGIATGVYLSEYSYGKSSKVLGFVIDLLMGVPSIVIGIFVFTVVVRPMGTFSAYAGALALAIIMMPIIARSTEEMLKTVPQHYREAGLALGLQRWKVISFILIRGKWGAIMTGIVLGVARIAGETAPLLFTSFNNQYWARSLKEPTAALPVQIYTYAISPYEEWQMHAWTGALVLIMFVFLVNLVIRFAFSSVRESRD